MKMFTEKLGAALKLLSSNEHSVSDDTQLETLISVIKDRLFERNGSDSDFYESDRLHELAHIEQFISKMFTISSENEDVHDHLPFSLQLAGIALRFKATTRKMNCETFSEQSLTVIFKVCSLSACWQVASVRSSWIAGIQELGQNNSSWAWLQSQGYIDIMHQCLGDSSVFVSSVTENFLTSFLSQLASSEDPQLQNIFVEQLSVCMKYTTSDILQQQAVGLRIINNVCSNNPACLKVLREKHDFDSMVARRLYSDNVKVAESALSNIKLLIQNSHPHDCSGHVTKLFELKNYKMAVRLSAAVLLSVEEKSTLELTRSVVTCPITCCLDLPRPGCIDEKDWGSLCDHMSNDRSACSLIKESLNCIQQAAKQSNFIDWLEEVSGLLTHRLFKNMALKILQTLLELLKSECKADEQVLLKTGLELLNKFTDSFMQSQVTSKALECLVAILPCLSSNGDFLKELGTGLMQKSCDTQWEIRDSVVTAVGSICSLLSEHPCLANWFDECSLFTIVRSSVNDGDSYVRASALQALGHVICCKDIVGKIDEVSTLESVLSIIYSDTEAFPRRAAVNLLRGWFDTKVDAVQKDEMHKAIQHACKDFDWEVKIGALHFWRHVIEAAPWSSANLSNGTVNAIPTYAAACLTQKSNGIPGNINETEKTDLSTLKWLQDCGCLDSLLSSVDDCDQPVQALACHLLAELKTRLKKRNLLLENFKSCEHSTEIKLLENMEKLESQDYESMAVKFSKTTDDYVRNPESLLDDILAVHQDDDVIVDCY